MPAPSGHPIYEALVIPNDALDKGGVEILRAGLVNDELYVTARRVFVDPATWGEVLADITRRLARIHATEGGHKEKEVLAAIESAFAADLGAPVMSVTPRAGKRKPAGRKAKAKTKSKTKPVRRKTAKARGKSSSKRKAR
jgi:hypothetical protein